MKSISSKTANHSLAVSTASAIAESPAQATSASEFTPEQKAYINELRDVVLEIDAYLPGGPGFSRGPVPQKGSDEALRCRDWLVGLAQIFWYAGVERVDLQPAAKRFMAREGEKFFPAPGVLIECANAARADRLARRPIPAALPEASEVQDYQSDEWRRLRNEKRVKLGLNPLPDEQENCA